MYYAYDMSQTQSRKDNQQSMINVIKWFIIIPYQKEETYIKLR